MVLYLTLGPGLVLAASVVFPLVGGILVAMRIKTKLRKVKKLEIEDWLVLPALILAIVMGIATVVAVASKVAGYTTPQTEDIAVMIRIKRILGITFWMCVWCQPLALGCIKLSFIFFYRRIFNVGPTKSVFNIVSLASIALIIVWMFGFFLAVMLFCPGHVEAYWGPTERQYCWKTTKYFFAYTWSDVGTDFLVLLMPLPSVLKLHIPTGKKVAIVGIFGLGAITVAASILRAVFYVQLLTAQSTTLVETTDPIMLVTNGIYWILLETGLALIAVNLPLLYGAFRSKGIETVIRSMRNFASMVSERSSRSSRSSRSNTKASSTDKTSRSSQEDGDAMVLVPGVQSSSSKAARTESMAIVDLEKGSGNINVTKSYTVDKYEQLG
ncbi:hypothetical protein BJ875DRAFT_421775 [Amylocarpus encephaloides]|uniref:Rhodopsin domain-containing protein n=1 Tax=Amylocarpus encephaloides TaxID=45428 RepID=A0A9P7YL46_9HELO|nr:hypothetical protein BJ875DRAFT_421775 [Amylocarpus encephaloides]